VRIVWSLPVRGERLTSCRGDVVRARHLIDALREDGHEVIVVEDAAHGHTHAAVAAYRTWTRFWLPSRLSFLLRDLGRSLHGCVHGLHVAATARANDADLIVETQVAYTVSGALASRLTGTPILLDDCSPGAEESVFGTGVPQLASMALSLQARAARCVVAVSPALAEMLAAEGVPREKIAYVPNGISVGAFSRAPARGRRTAPGLEGTCVVGFVGSFQPWHRVELLIEAVAALPAGCPIHVILAGGGPGLASVLEAAAAGGVQDRVTAIGTVPADAIPTLLAGWDVGVMPHSNAYGDPMKLREYAAAGIPSIAPDLAPIRDVLEHEATGLLFPPGDVEALAHALARLAADRALRRRLGEEAQRRAFVNGSWQERARALLAFGAPGPGAAVRGAVAQPHRSPGTGAQEA
jgi:glycosyltransferase involved in cell wall biosynthesis